MFKSYSQLKNYLLKIPCEDEYKLIERKDVIDFLKELKKEYNFAYSSQNHFITIDLFSTRMALYFKASNNFYNLKSINISKRKNGVKLIQTARNLKVVEEYIKNIVPMKERFEFEKKKEEKKEKLNDYVLVEKVNKILKEYNENFSLIQGNNTFGITNSVGMFSFIIKRKDLLKMIEDEEEFRSFIEYISPMADLGIKKEKKNFKNINKQTVGMYFNI